MLLESEGGENKKRFKQLDQIIDGQSDFYQSLMGFSIGNSNPIRKIEVGSCL